jgi:hypothetical protein
MSNTILMYSIIVSTLHVHIDFMIGAAGIMPGVFVFDMTSYSMLCLQDRANSGPLSRTNTVLCSAGYDIFTICSYKK